MPILIGRHLEGITLNSLEFAKDNDDNLLKFETEELANSFLLENGFSQELIDSSITFLPEQ